MPYKGGRGYTAPYDTTHIRVPEPIKNLIQDICNVYRKQVEDSNSTAYDKHELLGKFSSAALAPIPDTLTIEKQKAIKLAIKHLRAKKSKLDTINKLLRDIYLDNSIEITQEDLTR